MTKSEFSEIVFIDYLRFLLTEDKAKESFKVATGFDISSLHNRHPIEMMVDEATGHVQDMMCNFIVWAAENFWDEPEELEKMNIYSKVKEYLSKKKEENV